MPLRGVTRAKLISPRRSTTHILRNSSDGRILLRIRQYRALFSEQGRIRCEYRLMRRPRALTNTGALIIRPMMTDRLRAPYAGFAWLGLHFAAGKRYTATWIGMPPIAAADRDENSAYFIMLQLPRTGRILLHIAAHALLLPLGRSQAVDGDMFADFRGSRFLAAVGRQGPRAASSTILRIPFTLLHCLVIAACEAAAGRSAGVQTETRHHESARQRDNNF